MVEQSGEPFLLPFSCCVLMALINEEIFSGVRLGRIQCVDDFACRQQRGSKQDGVLTFFGHCGSPQENAVEEEAICSLPLIPEFPKRLDPAVGERRLSGTSLRE
jgi:hypothetical protein